MGAIPESQNPHKTIAAYAKDLDIVVFNGHVHTTELYRSGRREVLGAGRRRRGTGSDPSRQDTHQGPRGLPAGSVLEGRAPKEEYNYVLVDVKPGQPTKFTLNRFRPWSAEPFATVELFK